MARMLYALGVLASDSCVEVTAGDLQGSYLGQTKDKVNDVFRRATGGVLFIDEAYALAGQSMYQTEAVEQMIALCTSKEHLHKTVVIIAGYTKKMDRMIKEVGALALPPLPLPRVQLCIGQNFWAILIFLFHQSCTFTARLSQLAFPLSLSGAVCFVR